MKIAFLCCIHGNLPALEAVGKDLDAIQPDKVYCLGDVVNYGAQSRECVAYVRERNWPTLKGNHEAAVIDPSLAEEFTPRAKLCLYYTLGNLGKSEREWFKTLPESIEEADFQVVHGSPAGVMWQQYILNNEHAEQAFAAARRPWVFNGHTHVPMAFFNTTPLSYSKDARWKLERKIPALLNVGSVGQPRDKNPRSCYALFDTDTLEVQLRRIEYDIERAAALIMEAGLPKFIAERLKVGG